MVDLLKTEQDLPFESVKNCFSVICEAMGPGLRDRDPCQQL